MGYRTKYSLSVRNIKSEQRFNELVQFLKNKDIIHYAVCDGEYFEDSNEALFACFEDVKWYDHVDQMITVAEKFPEMYFQLEGQGEETGDFWRMYFHDMDIETCLGEVVYEQPNKIDWDKVAVF